LTAAWSGIDHTWTKAIGFVLLQMRISIIGCRCLCCSLLWQGGASARCKVHLARRCVADGLLLAESCDVCPLLLSLFLQRLDGKTLGNLEKASSVVPTACCCLMLLLAAACCLLQCALNWSNKRTPMPGQKCRSWQPQAAAILAQLPSI